MVKLLLLYSFLSLCLVNTVIGAGVKDFAKSDAFIQSLLSVKLGKSGTDYKTLASIQKGAFELLSSLRRPLTSADRIKYVELLRVASKANNTEKVHELIGKILFTIQSTESTTRLAEITAKYAPLLGGSTTPRARRDVDYFDEIYNKLYVLKCGATLAFAIDDTASMHENINEAITISKSIINLERIGRINYILSPFNDPDTVEATFRSSSEKALFIKDLEALRPHGGGDCPEYAFNGMQKAIDLRPDYGSSMFVFTDAAPKDAGESNVLEIIESAQYDDLKISFFLDERMCGAKTEIDKYRRVADETGGQVFTMDFSDDKKRRKRRSTAKSLYTSFVSSSLRGSSLVKTGAISSSSSNTHSFDIDDAIAYLAVTVTVERSPSSVSLSNPSKIGQRPSSTTKNAVIFEVENPLTGAWQLSVNAASTGRYNYKVSVAFKEPVDFDVRYFYEERRGQLVLVDRPIIGERQQLMINIVGGEKIDASSITASFVDQAGNHLATLPLENIGTEVILKFSASFIPPSTQPFRVRLRGITKKGLNFERTSDQPTTVARVVFKTVYAGEEFSAKIGGPAIRIMNVLFINKGLRRVVTVTAKARLGSVTPAEQSSEIRGRKIYFLQYTPPSTATSGKTDFITVQASYDGQFTTHQIPILLF